MGVPTNGMFTWPPCVWPEIIRSTREEKSESAVSGLKEAIKGDDGEAIKRALENLETASHKVAEAMYQAASAEQGAATEAAADGAAEEQPASDDQSKGDDDVIDAEYEVKD